MSDDDIDFEIEDEGTVSGGDFDDFMGGIEQQLKTMMQETAKAPKTAWEHWSAFSAAVDWTESWIRILLSFHVFVWLFVLVTRKNVDCQTIAFLFISVIVFMSERINRFAAENWQQFSKQNYFDSHGVFIGLMLTGPLILVLLFQLINFLVLTSSALIKSKRMELQRKYGKKKSGDDKADVVVDDKKTK